MRSTCLFLLALSRLVTATAIEGEWIIERKDEQLRWESLLGAQPIGRGRYALARSRRKPQGKGLRVQPNFLYNALPYRPIRPWARAMDRNEDPGLTLSWGLHNFGQAVGPLKEGVAGKDIGALAAWAIHTGNGSVTVAVLDTGIQADHEELRQVLWRHGTEVTNGNDDDGNGYVDDVHGWNFVNGNAQIADDNGHGTFCAGIIGAQAGNGRGSRGIAQVQILPIKCLDRFGQGTTASAVAAIEYAVSMGARVINASWGGRQFDQALYDTIRWAGHQGALIVAASGNDGANNDLVAQPIYPASFRLPAVISVAAYDNRDRLAPFSNFGKETVHVGAPGVGIFSTTREGYGISEGTSFAAPFVTGVAALVRSYVGELSLLAWKERLLESSAVVRYYDKELTSTAGRIHAAQALLNERPTRPKAPQYWTTEGVVLGTAHPYPNHTYWRESLYRPHASHVRIHFSRFETEQGLDRLTLKDGRGEVVAVYSGKLGSFWSADALGDTLVIEFEADDVVTAYGVEIDAVQTAWKF